VYKEKVMFFYQHSVNLMGVMKKMKNFLQKMKKFSLFIKFTLQRAITCLFYLSFCAVNEKEKLVAKRKFGNRAREIREYQERSQQEVANDCDLKRNAISAIENGTSNAYYTSSYDLIENGLWVVEEEFYQYGKKPEELHYKKKK
jgi:DNA-binding XRE family transcriptional regulator